MYSQELLDETYERLDALTVRELKGIAKKFGVCLGYSASTKATTVAEIVSQCNCRGEARRLMEHLGMEVEK